MMKKRWMYGLLLGASLCALSGCGQSSNEQSKDATPQSAESTSKDKEKSTDVQSQPCTVATPFNPDKPVYVVDNDDENMNVTAIVTPYLDTKDKVKVELYDTGDLQKTYIVDYKIEPIQKGSKDKLELYKYTFYENDSENGNKHSYIATLMTRDDLNNEPFIWVYPIENDKIPSDKKIRQLCSDDYGSAMTDESKTVTLK